jgi:regulator of protease activity HflC (stomatin/prohibitin superfamily)
VKKFRLKRMVFGCGTLFVLGLIGFGIWNSFLAWIPAGHVGVLFHASGGLERKVYTPRRLFIPWMTKLYVYPTMQRSAIYTNDPDESDVKASDAVRVTTNDNANTDFDIVVWYHIKPEDVLTIFDNFRTQPIEQIQSSAIRAAIRQAASNVGIRYSAFELMGVARSAASKTLTEELQKTLGSKGITVDRAAFAGTTPNETILQRITAQVNAETDATIAEIRRDIADAQKTIDITKATAQAKAAGLKAQQTKGKSLELLNLEADIEALKKWDGQLPSIQAKPGQTIVITPETLRALQGGQ